VYWERTQHVLIQESVGILDIEPPCTKHELAQYRGVCPQWVVVTNDVMVVVMNDVCGGTLADNSLERGEG
jgi:hypothetical protein